MSDKFILADDGKTPIPCTDLMRWGRFMEKPGRVVGKDTIGEAQVSTVFLGLNHNFDDDGPPVLWETMIFGGAHDEFQERYTSYEDAVAGHAKAVALVTAVEK